MTTRLENVHILCVDDEESVLEYLARTFSYADAVVIPAGTLEEARRVLKDRDVDFAIVDLVLGEGARGEDLEEDLQRIAIPHVYLTGYDTRPEEIGVSVPVWYKTGLHGLSFLTRVLDEMRKQQDSLVADREFPSAHIGFCPERKREVAHLVR